VGQIHPIAAGHSTAGSGRVDRLLGPESLFAIDQEIVGEVEQIAQDIGELFFEVESILAGVLLVEPARLADRLRQFADLFGEEQNFSASFSWVQPRP
jgi:hypothetical protein